MCSEWCTFAKKLWWELLQNWCKLLDTEKVLLVCKDCAFVCLVLGNDRLDWIDNFKAGGWGWPGLPNLDFVSRLVLKIPSKVIFWVFWRTLLENFASFILFTKGGAYKGTKAAWIVFLWVFANLFFPFYWLKKLHTIPPPKWPPPQFGTPILEVDFFVHFWKCLGEFCLPKIEKKSKETMEVLWPRQTMAFLDPCPVACQLCFVQCWA